MRRVLLHALLIVVTSVALGALVNAVRTDTDRAGKPRRLAWVTPAKAVLNPADIIALSEAHELWNSGAAFFLDARLPADFQAGHIALAHNLPADDFDRHYADVAGMLAPESPIVVYCDGEDCELSHNLMDRLRVLGFTNARVLVNGWSVWRNAGYPTQTGAGGS